MVFMIFAIFSGDIETSQKIMALPGFLAEGVHDKILSSH